MASEHRTAEAELLAIRERLQCLPDAKILEVLQSLLDDRDVAWQRVNAVTKALHQAQAENRELRKTVHEQLSGWQPIETAPKDGTNVLLCWFDGIAKPICHVGHNLGGGRRWQSIHQWLHNEQSWPTLWRPLPALPPSPLGESK